MHAREKAAVATRTGRSINVFPEVSMLPNGSRLSCGLGRPQSRSISSLSGGRRGPSASSAG